jgi:hypothetical protein
MSEQSKIFNLYESMNQSGVAYDQQRNKNSYKYTPVQGKPSFTKDAIPTVSSVKMQGAAYTPNGISDEEVHIKGYGTLESRQVEKLLSDIKSDIHELIEKNVTGAILKSKIDLYTSLIQQIT